MRFRRLLPLPVLLALCAAGQAEVEQLLKQGGFEFPPVPSNRRVARSEGGDPTRALLGERDWVQFRDSTTGEGGKVIAGLTKEQHHEGSQAMFVQFEKVTKKHAGASIRSELISIVPNETYSFSIQGRVDKQDPVALDSRVPYLKLQVEWFKKVKKSAPLDEDKEDDEDLTNDQDPEAAKKPAGEKPVEEKKAEEKKPEKTAAPAPGHASPTKKADEKKKPEEPKKAEAGKPDEKKGDEEATEDDDELEIRQTGKTVWTTQAIPSAKPLPGHTPGRPVFVAGKWSIYKVNSRAPLDASYVRVTWYCETSGEEGETNGVMYFDTATIEGQPGPKEDPFANDPELKKQMEAEANDPDIVKPDQPPPPVKPIPAVPITPPPPVRVPVPPR